MFRNVHFPHDSIALNITESTSKPVIPEAFRMEHVLIPHTDS